MKLLPTNSGEHGVSNVVAKWGIGPQIILWGLKTEQSEWRHLSNIDDWSNLRHDSGATTRGRHARRLRCKSMNE